jgi:Holliday junction resolvase
MTPAASRRGRRSRRKGAEGERELAAWLTSQGFPARRTYQRTGADGTADLEADGLERLHLECKRAERLSVDVALGQAILDALPGRVPVVVWRRNHGGWVAVLRADDLLDLLRTGPAFF